MAPKHSHTSCHMRLVDDAPSRARARGTRARSGYAEGGAVACEPAVFTTWNDSEVRRMPVRKVDDERSAAMAIAHVVGTDLSVQEHMVGLGLDRQMNIITVAVGSSHQKSICAFIAHDLIGSIYSKHPTKVRAMIIGHNHPSGDPHASEDDLRSMKKVLCEFIGAGILDHVIVSPKDEGGIKSFSMRDKYAMFDRSCR